MEATASVSAFIFNLESFLPLPLVCFCERRDALLPAIDRGANGCSGVSSELPAVTAGFHVDSALFQERHEWPFIINVIESPMHSVVQLIYMDFLLPAICSDASRVLFECVYFLPATPAAHFVPAE